MVELNKRVKGLKAAKHISKKNIQAESLAIAQFLYEK